MTPVASKRRSTASANTTSNLNIANHHNAHTSTGTPGTPIRQYFSRRRAANDKNLDFVDVNWVGIYSPWALFFGCIFLIVPVAYIYILLVLLRELCVSFPETIMSPIQTYLPLAGRLIATMHQSSALEVWCAIEAVFYVCLKLHIQWLQTRDPLEASLSAAPLMDLEDRRVLWQRMMDSAKKDPVTFITGWFFDQPITSISQYDIRDFLAWCMFEGRHQEHLTAAEVYQLEDFVGEVEWRISLLMHGEAEALPPLDGKESSEQEEGSSSGTQESPIARKRPWCDNLPIPKKAFRFARGTHETPPNFFSNMYESYRRGVEQMTRTAPDLTDFNPVQDLRNMVKNVRPVQDLKNLMAETAQHIADAEESAKATASHMYESLVPAGSQMDKQLSAMSHATYSQMTEAWNSVKNVKERLETARFLSKQRQQIRQQMKGYRVMLNRMREMSSAVPSKQMAGLMRRITECNEAMERLESRAQQAFVQATGFAFQRLSFLPHSEPLRYAKYSSDPLLGLATYPLGFHLLVLGATEIPLRVKMRKRGFERRTVGPVAYYFHPGLNTRDDDDDYDMTNEETPFVFVHGIGIGLIAYMPLIDELLKTGRPILLPEIPYVSGFRPLQSPNAVLQPHVVCGTMTAMLATHGFMRAAWLGHSYGTTWLSYLCKYAPHVVASVLFLDPICFCLHVPRLTKSFVYSRPDPGTISYMVRTDVIVNYTIQRSFPWAWVILFTEQIDVPVSIFLSEKDALVPAEKVEEYLRTKNVPVQNFEGVTEDHFRHPINCTVFRGDGHGDWTEHPSVSVCVPMIVRAAEVLCELADKEVSMDDSTR